MGEAYKIFTAILQMGAGAQAVRLASPQRRKDGFFFTWLRRLFFRLRWQGSSSSQKSGRLNNWLRASVVLGCLGCLPVIHTHTQGQTLTAASAAEKPSRRLVYGGDADYPPFEWLDKDGQPQGFNVDLIRALGQTMGYEVEIRLGPWPIIRRALIRDHQVDVSDMFYTEERARDADFATPFWVVHDEVFVRQGGLRVGSLLDLTNREVLCQEGSAAANLLRESVPGARLFLVPSEPEALRQLAAGHHDCAVVTRLAGRYAILQNGLRGLTTSGAPLWPRDYGFVTAKGRPELLAALNDGLAILKANGRFDQIYDKWFAEVLPRKPWLNQVLALLPWLALGLLGVGAAVVVWIATLRRRIFLRTRELHESEARLRLAVEAAHLGTFDWDRLNHRLNWSRGHELLWGFRPGEFDGTYEAFARRVLPEDLPALQAELERCVAARAPFQGDFRVVWPDGSVHWIAARGEFAFNASGEAVRMRGVVLETTARKTAEEALRHHEAILQETGRIAHVGGWEFDPASGQGTWTDEVARIHDLEPDQASNVELGVSFYVNESRARIEAALKQAVETGAPYDLELEMLTAKGNRKWVRTIGRPVWAAGKVVKVRGSFQDITERKRAEALLREREEQLRLYAECSPAAVAMFDREMRYLVASQRWMNNNQFKDQSFIGRCHYEMVPDIPQRWKDVHQRCLAGAVEKCTADPFRRADGRVDWIRWEVRPWHRADGTIGGIILFYEDITEYKEAELRIQQLNRIYSVLSDINQTIVREHDWQVMLAAACRIAVKNGQFRMAWIGMRNQANQELTPVAASGVVEGYTSLARIDLKNPAHAGGPTVRCLLSGEHAICNDIAQDPFYLPWRDEALRRGYRSSASFPLKIKGEVVGTFNLYANEPGYFDTQELHLLDELAMDISFAMEVGQREQARQRAEAELRWRTAFFEAQVDSSLDGVLVVDNQGKKLIQNRRMTELWKIPPEIAAKEDDASQVQYVTQQTSNPGQFADRVTYLYTHPDEIGRDLVELKDGTVLDRSSAPVRDKAGKLFGRIWIFRDITQQRRLEEQLRQSQKMEAIGQLAGGVAHDFNNILAAIMMQVELATTGPALPPEAVAAFDEIKADTQRAANLTRQLLAFSRRQVMQTCTVDLNDIVTNLSRMLRRILGEDVRFKLNLHPRRLLTRADAGMLDQVLLNLVVNSRDAMPDGGHLTIETTEQTVTEADLEALPETTPGRYVCLRVTDTGQGMAPEVLARIFEPFFTTKEPGKGTGLGLATVFGIVKQHGGAVTVVSKVGQGTTFQVLLRAEDAAVLEADAAPVPVSVPAAPGPGGGGETILLVEDEPAVRRLSRMVLMRAGYEVLTAANGVEALALWEQHGARIQLLFTDIMMPEGVSGRDLAARLQAQQPALRVIFTSGYSTDIAGQELVLQPGQNFLQKPALPRQMLEIVRQCLDA